MTLFDLPLICTLLALSPTYNYYYAEDANSNCILRLMIFLKDEKREENKYYFLENHIIEYSKIPKRKRPIQSNNFGYPSRRRLPE